jgi:hypothetical protein
MRGKYKRRPVADRFWEKVDRNGPVPEHCPELGPCWLWMSARLPDGRGQFHYEGRTEYAAIVAYILVYGPLSPETPCVLHKCDGGSLCCVRPDHLFAGTKADNITDMLTKGRSGTQGARHPQARLNAAIVMQSREMYAAGGISYQALADRAGVSLDTMYRAVRGDTWKHLL